ncbi:MAG: hypothetical protein ACPG32_12300, partial [Akkermansiaceae bacterium]
PEIQERISTALELAGTDNQGISSSLLEEIISEAETDVQSIDPQIEVRARKVRAWLWPALGIAAVFALLFAIWPSQTGRLLVRAVAPFSQTGNAGAIAFDILPGDMEVLEDTPVEITVLYQGSSNDSLILETEYENGETTQERLSFSGKQDGKQLATYTLPAAHKNFRYRVRAGRNESDAYQVTVWPTPRVARLDAKYDFPAYTGWARATKPASKVSAITGTEIRLQGKLNTPIESAAFLIDGVETGNARVDSDATGGSVTIDFPLTEKLSGVGTLMLKHRLSETPVEAARFPVKSIPDDAPTISLLTPVERKLRVRPEDQLPISYQVIEEVGLQSLDLDLKVNGQAVSPLPQLLPTRSKNSKKHLWSGELMVSVGDIISAHPKARVIELKLIAKDNRPSSFQGPGIGQSETITLQISRNAESLVRQELRAQESDIREIAEKAKQDIQQAAHRMDNKKEAVKKGDLKKHDQEQLEKAREQLAEAEKALKELAERMENGVHAPKKPIVEKAAEKAKEAREKLETSPLHDTPDDRKKELEDARKAADEAVRNLEKLRQKIEEDRQKVEDIARLNELAQKERELARKAAQKAEQAAKEDAQDQQAQKPDQDWKNQQRNVQEQLKREINERPEALAEANKKLAEKARELAQEARDQAEQQQDLQELSEQADAAQKKPENADAKQQHKDALQKQIEKEQQNLLDETKKQLDQAREQREKRADQLPEAVDQAKKALDQIQKQQPKQAAEAAKEAAENLEKLAQPQDQANDQQGEEQAKGENQEQGQQQNQQGDKADPELQDLAKRQEKVAEALDALAEGKNDEALEALQELQADAAKELADDINALPDMQGKSSEKQQATGKANQADQHAQQAAKQAEKGNQQAAAERNENAAQALDQAAEALDAEAKQLDAKAAQAAQQARQKNSQQAQKNQAPADAQQLADAHQKAADAAQAKSPAEAADKAQKAADALDQLAQQAMQNMKDGLQSGRPGQQPGQKPGDQPGEKPGNEPSEKPGNNPDEKDRMAQADPGVPPELAKLGISAKDWEKLKEMMRSDTAGSGSVNIPEDYRGLVKKYFQEVSRESK